MFTAHKIELKPNAKQAEYFAKACGTARFAYNWALDRWNELYKAGEKPNEAALRKELNAIKSERFPWMLEVTKCAPQLAIKALGCAFKNFFNHTAKHPRFHKKGVHDSFQISNDHFSVSGKRLKIPHCAPIRMTEALRFDGKILSATISREADRWYVGISCEVEDPPKTADLSKPIGVDLGITTLATLSNGMKIEGPKPYRHLLKRLRRLSRALSRKQKGSKNRDKARIQLAKLHARIAHIRKDTLHKLTTELARNYGVIGIEDLNVRGMAKNHGLARSIMDASFYEFRRQLAYKTERAGGIVHVADRWFPSSKTCSACGTIQDSMPLSVRSWICPHCGAKHDRDINAAVNLKNLAVSSTVSACGGEGAGRIRKDAVKLSPVKQESDSVLVV